MSGRVIIVEDEPAIADTLLYAFRSEGFEAEHAATAAAGLRLAAKPADLIILDLGLPDGNGLDVLRRLRSEVATQEVPVMLLTARSAEIDRIVGLEVGADDYVTKPFSPREVTARARAILRRTRKSARSSAEPGDANSTTPLFLHDAEKRQIRFSGAILDLTRYEYGVLALLLKRPGMIFTREMILQQVWEGPLESEDRTVDAHIKTIRAKLRGVREDCDPIQTHRGVGYSLREEL
ncbi:MAG: two-component system response regulator CreB [Leptospirales bacterium]|nr:two-component system response regulator CreB [Leptospirales bacterium]